MMCLIIASMAASYAATAMSPLQETIRIALGLSDNQMALLQGPALALPMAIAVVPLGLVIDRYSRVRLLLVLALCDLLGSALTAAASDFVMLIVARCLIGLTAFAVVPVVLSIIADLYAPAQRGRANMIIAVGQSAGVAASFAVGGTLLTLSSVGGSSAWRWAMLGLAVPLIFVTLLMLMLREPPRLGVRMAPEHQSARASGRELWQYRGLIVPLLIGVVMGQIALGADYVWAAPMLLRRFALPPDRIGEILAIAFLVSGVLGSVPGGVLADLCQRKRGPRGTMTVLSGISLLSVPAALFALVPGIAAASILFILFITLANSISVMGTTLFIVVMPNELRGLSVGILTAACVLIGTGLAPMMVSELAQMMGGPIRVGEALSYLCVATSLVAAGAFVLGRRFVPLIPDVAAPWATEATDP